MTRGQTLRQRWRDDIRDSGHLNDPHMVAVVFALDRDMSATGETRAGVRRVAELAACGKTAVADRIDRLIAAGWLRREGTRRQARYQATYPDGYDDDTGRVSSQGGQSVSSQGGQSVSGSARTLSEPECPPTGPRVSANGTPSVRQPAPECPPTMPSSRANAEPPVTTLPVNILPSSRADVTHEGTSNRPPPDDDDEQQQAHRPRLVEALDRRIAARHRSRGGVEQAEVAAVVDDLIAKHGARLVESWLSTLDDQERFEWPSEARTACHDWCTQHASAFDDPAEDPPLPDIWSGDTWPDDGAHEPPPPDPCGDLPAGVYCTGAMHLGYDDAGRDLAEPCSRARGPSR